METIPFDFGRMLWGDSPPLYLLEILLRIAVIWPYTLLLLRWIGGRSIAQLSLAEFLLVIALGSAVGDALFLPDVPLLHAMLVILAVIVIDKLMDILVRRYPSAKQMIDGTPIEVVRDGQILGQGLEINAISSPEVMELLRLRGVDNLGSVGVAYIEPSGQISVFAADPPRFGLPIVPPPELVKTSAGDGQGQLMCCCCGATVFGEDDCEICGQSARLPGKQAAKLNVK